VKVQKESRVVDLFFNLGARCVVSATPRPPYTRDIKPVPIVQEAGWAPGPVWKGAENLAATGIRSPDRPACNETIYRLSYPGQFRIIGHIMCENPLTYLIFMDEKQYS